MDKKLTKMALDAYKNKEMAAKEYRHRAMTWGVQAAYYTALPIWLLNCWGVVTIADMLSMVSTEMVNTEDKHQAMLDLAYLYENMIMRNRSNGGYETGVEALWRFCEMFNIDIVIMYVHMGCKSMSGYHGLFEEEARKHGIHLIWVTHNLMCPEDGTRRDMRTEINTYVAGKDSRMKYFGGCDAGSTYTKCVIIDENGKILAAVTKRSRINPVLSAKDALDEAVSQVDGLNSAEELTYLIGTGYGRNKVPFADENISEISCHAMGVHVTDPSVKAIIDIGGQDVKGIAIDTDGTVLNFAMNDKCAAGTGRFFESMARAFEMSLDEFSNLSLTAKNVIPITAQCAVFAESEVISLVGEGKPMEEIAAGIQLSVAKRCFVMAKKAGAADSVTLTGGCAKNEGLKKAIEKVLKINVVDLPTDPQLMGALGAAEYARQKGSNV